MKRFAAVMAALGSLVLAGCGDSIQSPDFTAQLRGIQLVPSAAVSLPAGRTTQLEAVGLFTTPPGTVDPTQDNGDDGFFTDDDGSVLSVGSVTASFISSNTNTATVDSDGLVTAVAVGTTSITATADGQTSNAVAVTVTAAVLESIAIDPPNASVSLTRTQRFNAVGTFSDGTTDDVTVNWVSEDTGIATVAPATGESTVATTLAEGVADITATFPGSPLSEGVTLTDSATLNVTPFEPVLVAIEVTPLGAAIPVGLMQQFTATGTFSTQTPGVTTMREVDEDDGVVWTLDEDDAAFAVIDAQRGIVTANAIGEDLVVTATAGEVAGSTTFDVVAPVIVRIDVLPPESSIALGTTVALSAQATLSNGVTTPVQANWSSSDTNFVNLDPVANVVTTIATAVAVTVDPVTVTAAVDADNNPGTADLTGTATVAVTDAVLNGLLRLEPTAGRVTVGRDLEFTAIGSFTDGSEQVVDDSLVTWTATDPLPDQSVDPIATIAADGVASGVTLGVSTIAATLNDNTNISGATSATGQLTVTDRVCTTPLLAAEGAVAQAETAPGCILCGVDDVGNVTNSVADDFATIRLPVALLGASAGVRVDANDNPNYTLPFAAGNNAGFLVSQPSGLLAVAELLSQVRVSTLLGDTVQEITGDLTPLRVELLGSELIGGETNETVLVSIATTQPYDAIRLSLNGGTLSALTSLRVTQACGTVDLPEPAAPLERIERIEPLTSTIITGATTNLVAIGRYTDGTEQQLADADIDWSSSNDGVADVDANGLATGNAAGSTTITAALKAGVDATTNGRSATANVTVIDSVCTSPFLASEGATASSTINGLCLLCNVANLANVIDASPTTAARIGVTLGLLNGSATVRVNDDPEADDQPAGQTTGFVIGRPVGTVLLAEAISQIRVDVLNDGLVVESSGPTIPLRVDLLGNQAGSTDETGLVSVTPTVPYDGIQITFSSGLLSAGLQNDLTNLSVFQACAQATPVTTSP